MHGDAGRLVDGDEVGVLEDDRELAPRHRAFFDGGRAHRRDPHVVAEREARLRIGATLVHAHLARADHAIDVRLGHALQQLHEEVVEALPGAVFADPNVTCGRGGAVGRSRTTGRTGVRPYNSLLHATA